MQGTEIHTDPKPKAKMSGREIKRSRKRKGISQKKLAKRLGCHYTTISKYENGHRTMRGTLAIKARKLLEPKETDR